MTNSGPTIPLAVFMAASGHRGDRCSPLSARGYGECGWRARREMQEGVETFVVPQPSIVSEVLLQCLLSMWGVLLPHFRL